MMISGIEGDLLLQGCQFLSGTGRRTKWYSRKSTRLCLQHILLFETFQRRANASQLGSMDASRKRHLLRVRSDSRSYSSRQSLDIDGNWTNPHSLLCHRSSSSRRLTFVLVALVITILWVAQMICAWVVSTPLSNICMQLNDRSVRCQKAGVSNRWIWYLSKRTVAIVGYSPANSVSISHANGHWILLKDKCLTFVCKWSTKSTWNNFLFDNEQVNIPMLFFSFTVVYKLYYLISTKLIQQIQKRNIICFNRDAFDKQSSEADVDSNFLSSAEASRQQCSHCTSFNSCK